MIYQINHREHLHNFSKLCLHFYLKSSLNGSPFNLHVISLTFLVLVPVHSNFNCTEQPSSTAQRNTFLFIPGIHLNVLPLFTSSMVRYRNCEFFLISDKLIHFPVHNYRPIIAILYQRGFSYRSFKVSILM